MKNESVMCMDIHVTHDCSSKTEMHMRSPETFRNRQVRVLYPDIEKPGLRSFN